MVWNFNNSTANETALRPLCEQVDKFFDLPAARRYCYFAVADDEYLTDKVGRHYRGLNAPTSSRGPIPEHAFHRYLPADGNCYDHLIYIRNSTCLDPTGCVITYAHEVQHTLQCDRSPRVMQANWVLRANLAIFDSTATEIDIPIEADANIVSKRIAESVCGIEHVRNFAEEQLALMRNAGAIEQERRWEYFLEMPSSTPYDYVDETKELVRRYAQYMDFGMDVHAPDWWKGSLDSPAGPP